MEICQNIHDCAAVSSDPFDPVETPLFAVSRAVPGAGQIRDSCQTPRGHSSNIFQGKTVTSSPAELSLSGGSPSGQLPGSPPPEPGCPLLLQRQQERRQEQMPPRAGPGSRQDGELSRSSSDLRGAGLQCPGEPATEVQCGRVLFPGWPLSPGCRLVIMIGPPGSQDYYFFCPTALTAK